MESHSILVPKGWEVTGGGWWARAALYNIYPSQDITVQSPEGLFVRVGPLFMATDFYPSASMRQYGFKRPREGSIDNGIPTVYLPNSLDAWRTWLQEKVFPQEYPKATNFQVHKSVVLPELTALLNRQMEPARRAFEADNRKNAALGLKLRGSLAAASVLAFELTLELDGTTYDAMLVFAHMVKANDTEGGRQVWWTIGPVVTFAAPKGKLERAMPLLMAISNSVRPMPQWTQMRATHIGKLKQIAMEGAVKVAAIWSKHNRDMNKILNDGWKARGLSMDRTQRKFVQTLREVETFTTGSGTPVELPSQYSHVFSNGQGEYLLSNNALFDPNTDKTYNGTSWTTMTVAK